MGDAPMYTEWGMPPQASEAQVLSPYVHEMFLHASLPPGRALSPNPSGQLQSTLHAHQPSTTSSATTAHHQPLQVTMESSSSLHPSHQYHPHPPALQHGPSSTSSHLPLKVSPIAGGGQPTPSVLYPASSVSSANAKPNPNEGASMAGGWAYEWHQRPPPPPPPNPHSGPSSLSRGPSSTLHHQHQRTQLHPRPPTHRSHSSLSTRPFGLAAEERFGGDGYGHSVPLVPLPSLPALLPASTSFSAPAGSASSNSGPPSNGRHPSPGRTLQHPLPQTYHPSTTASAHLLGRPGPPTRTLSTPIPAVAPFPPPPPPPNVHAQEHYYHPYDVSRLGVGEGSAGEEEGWLAGTSSVGAASGGGGGVEEGKRRADEGGSKPNDEQDKQARRREQNRAAQRAYKARQNKHVEEVEVRNKQLISELVERTFEMENMKDLLARIQRENDILKTKLYPLSAPPAFEPFPVDFLDEESKDPLQRILDAHHILPCPPPHLRPLPSDEDRREEARKHGVFLMEKWARFGIKQERDARGLDEKDEEGQELKGVGKISDESPIDEDNLQNLLGPRYWEVASRLVPAPPRVPFRGIWREIQSAVPDVRQDDVDVGSLCDAFRRAAFCDGVEACIPQSAFEYIIETIIEPTSSTNAAAASALPPPSNPNNNQYIHA